MICLCVQKLQQTKHKHTQAIHFKFGAVLCCCKSLSNLLGLWEGRMERFKRIGKKKYDSILCNSYLIWFDLIWFDCNEVEHQIFVCSIFFYFGIWYWFLQKRCFVVVIVAAAVLSVCCCGFFCLFEFCFVYIMQSWLIYVCAINARHFYLFAVLIEYDTNKLFNVFFSFSFRFLFW